MTAREKRADGGGGSSIRRCRWQSASNATERSLSRFLAGTPPERRPEPVQLLLIELQADLVSVPPAHSPESIPQAGAFSSEGHCPEGQCPQVAALVTPQLSLTSETPTPKTGTFAVLPDSAPLCLTGETRRGRR